MSGLALIGWGARTPVGDSAAETYAALRAGLPGYRETDFFLADDAMEQLIAAVVPGLPPPDEQDPYERLIELSVDALRECARSAGLAPGQNVPVLLALADTYREKLDLDGREAELLERVVVDAGLVPHPESRWLRSGRSGVFEALDQARSLIRRASDICIVGGIDSLLNVEDLTRLEEAFRIKGEDNSEGLIPGEAAAFVAVGAPGVRSGPEVLGLGRDREPDETCVLGPGHPTGRGLQRALENALVTARTSEDQIVLRVSDLTGERYGGIDALFAMSRVYRSRREVLDLWHPADCVGDVGAAAGALQLGVVAHALARGYAPGAPVMCEASSDDGTRWGCVVAGNLEDGEPFQPGGSPASSWREEQLAYFVEEASFLWRSRERAATSGDHDLSDLVRIDRRLEAHLDALVQAQSAVEPMVEDEPHTDDAAFVWAFVWALRDPGGWARRCEPLATRPELVPALVSALQWIPESAFVPALASIDQRPGAELLGVSLRALVGRGREPGERLVRGFSADPQGRLAAEDAAAALGRFDLLARIAGGDAAATSSLAARAALGDFRAAERVLERALAMDERLERDALAVALLRLEPGDARAWRERLELAGARRAAILACGMLGDVTMLDRLLEHMREPEHARVAGEAFAAITGADFDTEPIAGEPPEGWEEGPTDDTTDDRVEIPEDADLPWPEVTALEAWLKERRSGWSQARPLLCGTPRDTSTYGRVLREGYQRQRSLAALLQLAHSPGSRRFDVTRPTFRQIRELRLDTRRIV